MASRVHARGSYLAVTRLFHTQMRIKTQYLFDHHLASHKIGEGTYLKGALRLLRLDHRRNTISMEDL